MTNKPMLSVERELLEDFARYADKGKAPEPWMVEKLRALLGKEVDGDSHELKQQGDPFAWHCTHPPGCKWCNWCGFKAEQPAPVAVVMPERDGFDIDDWAGSFCQEALSFGVGQDVFARFVRTTIDRTLAEVARLNGVKP